MEGNKTEPLKGKRLYTYWSEICEDKEEVYSNNPACVFDIEDVKSAVDGLLDEIEKMPTFQIVPRFEGINLVPKSDVKILIKKWFADVFEDE